MTGTDVGSRSPSTVSSVAWRKASRKLVALRENLYLRRLSLKEKRNQIKEQRIFVDELVAKLLTSISRSLELGAALDEALIRDLRMEISAKKDELGALEYDYDQAEEDYNQAEENYNQAELIEQEDEQEEEPEQPPPILPNQIVYSGRDSLLHRINYYQPSQSEPHSRRQSRHSLLRTQTHHSQTYAPNLPCDIRNIGSQLKPPSEAGGVRSSIGEDSEHESLEATFLNWKQTKPVQEHRDYYPKSEGSRRSDHGDYEYLLWESASQSDRARNASVEPTRAHHSKSRPKCFSESSVPTLRRGLVRRRSRIMWWLFNTFGSSSVDYLERAKDIQKLPAFEDKNSETWARLVYEYWTRKRIPTKAAAVPGEGIKATDSREIRHVGFQSLGGSHLLLPSGLPKLESSVENVNRLFSIPPETQKNSTPTLLLDAGSPDLPDHLSV